MEVISSENYLAESPQSVVEEPVQSLYADDQPKKRQLRNFETYSKLADTVGIENTIMLNAEDLVKASGRAIPNTKLSRDEYLHDKNLRQRTRSYGYGTNRRNETARHYYEGYPSNNDMNLGNSTTEPRTSVIQALSRSVAEPDAEQTVGEKDELEKSDYNHLRCYEQFGEETGSVLGNLGIRGNYVQNASDSRMEGSRIITSGQSDNTPDRISEKLTPRGARCYPAASSVVDPNRTVYAHGGNGMFQLQQQHELASQYRMQQPADFQPEQRGKHWNNLVQSTGPGMVARYQVNHPHSARMPDGLFVQTHGTSAADLASTYSQGYSVYETRSPASSTSSGKDRESLPDQEGLKNNVQHYPSPVGSMKDEHGQPSPRSSKAIDETTESKQSDGNKVKGKRNTSAKSDNAIKCGQCLKSFGSSSALAKHKLTHSDERRYVCNICGKGFKRQDHLNGHMLTHRDKKPYECKFADCDKSYCDMRSLRRHYENYHPSPDSAQAGTGNVGSTKPGNEAKTNKVNSRQQADESFSLDTEESHDSPQSNQEVVSYGRSKQDNNSRKRNSDSICSNSSDDFNRKIDSHSPHNAVHDKPAVNMLKQAVEHSQDFKNEKQSLEGYPPHGYYPFQDGLNQQWYPYPSHFIPLYQFNNNNQRPVLVPQSMGQYGQVRNSGFPQDPPQLVPNYPSATKGSTNNEQNNDEQSWKKRSEENYSHRIGRKSTAPTDPTSIAISNVDEHIQQSLYKNVNQGFPPVVQWKSVPVKENSGMPPFSMGNNPGLMKQQHNAANVVNPNINMLTDHLTNHEQSSQLNISIPSYQGDKRTHDMVDREHTNSTKRHCPQLPVNNNNDLLLKLADNNNIKLSSSTTETNNQDDVFRNPPSTPPRKARPKPEPIHIPSSNFVTSPHSPPIYTPPPMLSPRSIFHVSNTLHTPRCSGTPITPSRFFMGNRSRKNSLEGEPEQSEIIIPEPKINIGPQFQADVPEGIAPHKLAEFDKHRVSVCWIPFEHETKKRAQEIEAFLDMACSVAVHGGGSNKEYALHVLFRLKGNIKQAVRHILANKSAIQKGDGLADYHYQGSDRWSTKERLKFREALNLKGKDFFQISKELETKTVAQCVEFYYLWKATHPEAMRSRTRYVETESESEVVEYFSDDSSSTLVFECDFPGCNSKFISRQALNGHIRVHGGSFMKPSEPKRVKIKTTANSETTANNVTTTTTTTNVGRPPSKPKPASTPAPVIPNGDGTLPEFACKVCGRIFHKIKSRSAHMKTHVKRNDDDHMGSK